jgi:ADP-dependent NAD(P)H-hydrate dehydratase / NAD(P)H-hydrate epimerase
MPDRAVMGAPILTAAQMRAAEDRAIAAGSSVSALMERAGTGVAEWVHRLAAGAEVLILCGPGNNGGDGYVVARVLASRGMPVRVAAVAAPRTEAAAEARKAWTGPVEPMPDALSNSGAYSGVYVDAAFGTGLNRPLPESTSLVIERLVNFSKLAIAVDVPSGIDADTGNDHDLFVERGFDVTLALGALKPAHLLQPTARLCGTVQLVDLGLGTFDAPVRAQPRPWILKPQPWTHKYSRGMVAVVSGPMHGASELAALAGYRAGAGYVLLLTGGLPHPPHAIVRQRWSAEALDDKRLGAVVIGPGLGRDDRAREKLEAALASPHPLVIDGDALHLLDLDRLQTREAPTVLTPHSGEFAALFGDGEGSKIARTQDAARRSGAVVVFKGADTVIAAPDGSASVALPASPWLSVAGTGDVLAGAIATMLAQNHVTPIQAASTGVWLHAEAARLLNRCFLADELADALPRALEQRAP